MKEGLLLVNLLEKLLSKSTYALYAPVAGTTVTLNRVPDTAIARGLLGEGIAIEPTDGKVYAPCDAVVERIFETGHAVSLVADFGAEILIHVGLDTVALKGRFFTVHVANGSRVKQGDLLLEFDLDAVKKLGYNPITPLLVHNSSNYGSFKPAVDKTVTSADVVIELRK